MSVASVRSIRRFSGFVPVLCVVSCVSFVPQALAESSASAKPHWWDSAAKAKHCPAVAVNVPPGLMGTGSKDLGKYISIAKKTLTIDGTNNPDHIVLSPTDQPGWVAVNWNGNQLGPYGPVTAVVLQGNGGDDVLIAKPRLNVPAILDGGDGDDCVQGGSGGDVVVGGNGDDLVIAGTGRPVLDSGAGNNKVVVPQHLGKIRYAPSVDRTIVGKLGQIYDLEPLCETNDLSPIVLGPADLNNKNVMSQLKTIRSAQQAVVLLKGSPSQIEKLRRALGQPNTSKTIAEKDESEPPAITFFRTARRPGTRSSDFRIGTFRNLPGAVDEWTTEKLSQVFSAIAVVPDSPSALAVPAAALGDSASNDITNLSNSFTDSQNTGDGAGDSVGVTNAIYGVRLFNSADPGPFDIYYVQQVVEYHNAAAASTAYQTANSNIQTPTNASLLQSSPATTGCTSTTGSSVTYSISGSVGWNTTQGLNASLSEGVSISHTKSIACQTTQIENMSDPTTGVAQWGYTVSGAQTQDTSTYTNQWVWKVPFQEYQAGQTFINVYSGIAEQPSDLNISFQESVPIPFGDTETLQPPQVTGVTPACVNAGNNFKILGTGLYPSMITDVLIDGQPLTAGQYQGLTDSAIGVTAPDISGEALPIVVKTGEGTSGSKTTIEISTIDICNL